MEPLGYSDCCTRHFVAVDQYELIGGRRKFQDPQKIAGSLRSFAEKRSRFAAERLTVNTAVADSEK